MPAKQTPDDDQPSHHHSGGHGFGPHHDHGNHHSQDAIDETAMAELVDLDAEVLDAYLSELTAWIHELSHEHPVLRMLDLGSGTGTGTFVLLDRFDVAQAVAVDLSAAMLDRLMVKARERNLADKVRTVQADLDAGWPDVDNLDLVWASASMHHLADPDRVLADVYAALNPGGLLAVVELESFPRFLPDDLGLGQPGLEARVHAVLAHAREADLPHMGSDWGLRLSKAGFEIAAERTFAIDLEPPLPAAAGRYAQASLRRARAILDDQLSADDLATLDILLDSDGPDGLLHRDDLTVRAVRTVWVARRP